MRLRHGRPIIVLLALFGVVLPVPGGADERTGISLANLAKASGCKGEPTNYVSGYFSSDDKPRTAIQAARAIACRTLGNLTGG